MAGKIIAKTAEAVDCGYWPEEKRTSMVVMMAARAFTGDLLSYAQQLRYTRFELMEKGYLGQTFSACATICPNCRACVPIRVNLDKFTLTTSQRKLLKKSQQSLTASFTPARFDSEMYDMFKNYLRVRHSGTGSTMIEMTKEEFRDMALAPALHMSIKTPANYRIGVGFIDKLTDRASFDYAFFNPVFNNISPGKLIWLKSIEALRQEGVKYIYVGAWAKGSPKLAYKQNYAGLETFVNGKWDDFDPAIHTEGPDYSAKLEADNIHPT